MSVLSPRPQLARQLSAVHCQTVKLALSQTAINIRFYNDAGQMTHQFFSNTTRASYAYDDAGQVLRISHLKPDKTTLTSFRYTYDSAGNRTGVSEHSGDAVAWTYDNTYQLKRETRTGGTSSPITGHHRPTRNHLHGHRPCAMGEHVCPPDGYVKLTAGAYQFIYDGVLATISVANR